MIMTSPPVLAIIAAVARNGVIGADGRLPWRLPADLRHFKMLTSGHAVIMGRRTWDSLGRPLPNRQNIVVTRQAALVLEGAAVAHSLGDALGRVQLAPPAFCIGGGELYREALDVADTVYLTEIEGEFDGDVTFPQLATPQWLEVARERPSDDAAAGPRYAFVTYRRRGEAGVTPSQTDSSLEENAS